MAEMEKYQQAEQVGGKGALTERASLAAIWSYYSAEAEVILELHLFIIKYLRFSPQILIRCA